MSWEFDDDRPIYLQIMEKIQLKIICGTYKSGEKLPSVRDIANEASVNPNTMQKALTELEKLGLVFSKRTSGRFITEDSNLINSMKTNLAKDQINNFLNNMNKIGYTKEETLELVNNIIKEMK